MLLSAEYMKVEHCYSSFTLNERQITRKELRKKTTMKSDRWGFIRFLSFVRCILSLSLSLPFNFLSLTLSFLSRFLVTTCPETIHERASALILHLCLTLTHFCQAWVCWIKTNSNLPKRLNGTQLNSMLMLVLLSPDTVLTYIKCFKLLPLKMT